MQHWVTSFVVKQQGPAGSVLLSKLTKLTLVKWTHIRNYVQVDDLLEILLYTFNKEKFVVVQ